MCHGHRGQLQSLIRQLEALPYPDQTSYSGEGQDSAIGCISFAGLRKERRSHPPSQELNRRNSTFDSTSTTPDGANQEEYFAGHRTDYSKAAAALAVPGSDIKSGRGSICAFYQGTGGASFSLTQTLTYLRTLANAGADPCGSIQINEPYGNNITGRELTVNYNAHGLCDGYCGSSHDVAGDNGVVLKKDPAYDYPPGWCGLHLTWYQRPLGTVSPADPNYYLGVFITDANHLLVSATYYLQAPPGTAVSTSTPELPYTLELMVLNDTAPIQMKYAGENWDTTMNGCQVGNFDAGKAGINCGFQCGQSLGPACFVGPYGAHGPPEGVSYCTS